MTYPGTILKAFKLLAKKELGQNFLSDPNTAGHIVNLAGITDKDIVLEIGPGLGALTVHAAKQARKVVAVEKDHRLIQHLQNELASAGADNVELIHRDVLKVNLDTVVAAVHGKRPVAEALDEAKTEEKNGIKNDRGRSSDVTKHDGSDQGLVKGGQFDTGRQGVDPPEKSLIILGNLPYNISSQVLFQLVKHRRHISKAVLMFQKELAERICAPAGGREYGRLSVAMQYCANVKILTHVRADLFFPKPNVESTVIEVAFVQKYEMPYEMEDFFFKVIKAAFSKRRKTLRNSLFGGELKFSKTEIEKGLTDAGIDPVRRAETLCVEEFVALTRAFWPDEVHGD